MSRHGESPELIEEIESVADRAAHWIAAHAWQVGGALLLVLALAGGIELARNRAQDREAEASNALEGTRAAYLRALGAPPGALELPELANPKAALAIQEEYLGKFRAVADAHPDSVAGILALFETADVLAALGRAGEVPALWEEALRRASGRPPLEGLVHQRIAAAHEQAGAWAEAAAAHEAAAGLAGYPLRHWALADAARSWAAAGEPAKALALYERIETEAPDLQLPDYQRSQLRELRAAQP
jgi:hypothetical protein